MAVTRRIGDLEKRSCTLAHALHVTRRIGDLEMPDAQLLETNTVTRRIGDLGNIWTYLFQAL